MQVIIWKTISSLLVCKLDRRGWIWKNIIASTASLINSEPSVISSTEDILTDETFVSMPLERCSGGRNCVRITVQYQPVVSIFDESVSYVPYKIFKLAVDTGSPYLVVSDGFEFASFVNEVKTSSKSMDSIISFVTKGMGFLENTVEFILYDSGFSPTFDVYGSQSGTIWWKKSFVQFSKLDVPINLIFGVLDDKLSEESGGSLLGLVKTFNRVPSEKVQARPTFFDQLRLGNSTVSSFRIDSSSQRLILSTKSMIPLNSKNAISLVNLLELGDFVDHYAIQVNRLDFGDMTYTANSIASAVRSEVRRDIVAVFDTGLTGCLLTTSLWDDLTFCGLNLNDIHSLDIGVMTDSDDLFNFSSSKSDNPFFKLSPITLDWFDDEDKSPYVVVLGQTFLTKGALTIDIDDRKLLFDAS